MLVLKRLIAFVASSLAVLSAGSAIAQTAGTGQPHPWQVGLQGAASPVMHDVVWFHNFLLWLIAIITVFVLILLGESLLASANAIIDALDAHQKMSQQALGSEKVRAGLKDILLGPAQLYEALRGAPEESEPETAA